MEQIGKLIIILGAVLVAFGLILWILGKSGWKGMPGDIRIETEKIKFYFPIVTCIVISIILTLILLLWKWLRKD